MSDWEADRILDAFIETITETLAKGERVRLIGFGTFSATRYPAREGRNPQTGEMMHIREKTAPKFRAGKRLKDALNRQR